jgi:hypothetical protein
MTVGWQLERFQLILFKALESALSKAFCVLKVSLSRSIITIRGAISKLTPTKEESSDGIG